MIDVTDLFDPNEYVLFFFFGNDKSMFYLVRGNGFHSAPA